MLQKDAFAAFSSFMAELLQILEKNKRKLKKVLVFNGNICYYSYRSLKTRCRSGGMADASDSKSDAGNSVWVQVPSPAR